MDMDMMGHNHPEVSADGLSPEDRKVLRKALQELNDSLTRAGAERDLQKEIINEVFDKIGVDKKLVRRLAKVYYKANFKDEVEANDRFQEFYDLIVHKTTD